MVDIFMQIGSQILWIKSEKGETGRICLLKNFLAFTKPLRLKIIYGKNMAFLRVRLIGIITYNS